VRTKNVWLLESPAGVGAPIEDHIEALIGIVDARREVFEALTGECDIDLVVACEVPPQLGFVITETQVSRLAHARLALTFSLYGTTG
jgi:hypothetical protein